MTTEQPNTETTLPREELAQSKGPHTDTNQSGMTASRRTKASVVEIVRRIGKASGSVAAATAMVSSTSGSGSDAYVCIEERDRDGAAAGVEASGRDDTGGRMEAIAEILKHRAMHLLDECALLAEWVGHVQERISDDGQVVTKPKGGRPEGGVTRAADELPVPGKTFGARRQYIVRALKIDGIREEAKVAAREAKLDDIQSALLSIADEKSLDAQLAKIKELRDRRVLPRRRPQVSAKRCPVLANTDLPVDAEFSRTKAADSHRIKQLEAALSETTVRLREVEKELDQRAGSFASSTLPPDDEPIPCQPLGSEDQRVFDDIKAAILQASPIVKARLRHLILSVTSC